MWSELIGKNKHTLYIVLACLSYLLFQLYYTHFSIIEVDEFWFAHRIYQYKNAIPYHDFAPYKTVLGYYILLPTMILSHDFLTPLFDTKNFIALLNAILLFVTASWLKSYFAKPAVLLAMVILIFSDLMLSYSTNIRVDFIAYWLCLFSVLFLLENKFITSGILLSLGFATSQKVLWYIVASNMALVICWLIVFRNREMVVNIIKYNLSLLLGVFVYVLIWSYFSSFHTVLKSIFYEAYVIYKLDIYTNSGVNILARYGYWMITIIKNPLLFLLWPLTILSLFVVPKDDKNYTKRIFIVTYSWIILFSLIKYKQVFPYYMLTTIPAFVLLYTAFFSWFYDLYKGFPDNKIIGIGKSGVWGIIFIYLVCFAYAFSFFALPLPYLLIGIIPIFLGIYITKIGLNTVLPPLLLIAVLFTGLVYPLMQYIISLDMRSGSYQQYSLKLLNNLLTDPKDDYLAGIELIYNKNQPIAGLRHLDMPAMAYLYKQDERLRPVMLESLYHSPNVTINKAIAALKESRVKLYVNNYRMMLLPPQIKDYLSSQYEHFSGSIYLYSPQMKAGRQDLVIKFTGNYQLESLAPITLNKKVIYPNALVKLPEGEYRSISSKSYRLKLIPDNMDHFFYINDEWKKMLT